MEVCAALFVLVLMAGGNARCFEDCEQSILDIKSFFFRTLLDWSLVLLDWSLVLPSYSCFSPRSDHCNLGS